MKQLMPQGRQAIDDIARRHGFSAEAVTAMLWAVVQGQGSMAQFGHPEFGGPGQWMRNGMTMVSDMFNHALKARVDGLCNELASLVASQPELLHGGGSFQSQNQGNGGSPGQQQSAWSGGGQPPGAGMPPTTVSLFVPAADGGGDWWGPGLGRPHSSGAQNGVRYAYFAQARRLAIELHGRVTVYDTLDRPHRRLFAAAVRQRLVELHEPAWVGQRGQPAGGVGGWPATSRHIGTDTAA
jgi:hypothetical protein